MWTLTLLKDPLGLNLQKFYLKIKTDLEEFFIVLCSKYNIGQCAKKWSKDLFMPGDYNWREIF